MSIDKPTLKKPVTKQSRNFEDEAEAVNSQHGIKENEENPFMNEVDVLLNEDEMSLKKKIFSLPKMEALVHSHPRLSEIYREMAADGEERYGYHYNETIMNIIFNDYVLNDAELLQLYKTTKPKEKKRRDKSGIKQLQKSLGSDDMKDKQDKKEKKEKKVEEGGVSIEGLPAKGQEPAIHGGKIVDKGHGEGLSAEDKKLKKSDIKSVDTVTKPAHTKVDNKTYKIGVEETTTGSVGGGEGGFGSGGYATPHAWSSKGDLMGNSKKKDKEGKVLRKALRENNNYLIDSTEFEHYYNELNESFDSNIGDLMNEFMTKHIRETSKQEKINEDHLNTPEQQAEFIAQHTFGDSKYSDVNYILSNLHPHQIKIIYDYIEKNMGDKSTVTMLANKGIDKGNMNEHHLDENNPEELARFVVAGTLYNQGNMPDSGMLNILTREFAAKGLDYLRSAYRTVESQLGREGIAAVDNLLKNMNETEGSMIAGSDQSMAFKPDPQGDQGSIPMGMQDSGGMNESNHEEKPEFVQHLDNKDKKNKIDWNRTKNINTKPVVHEKFTSPIDGNEMFEELNEELKAFSVHHNKLKSMTEDKRPSSLVLKDRLGKDNESNFKKDMKDSATKDVVKMEKDMAWKEQQEEVGKNPYKKGEDLEKQSLKNTKGEALKNVGNSANPDGDEVTKRNLTDDEQNEVDMYRLGQQDLVYDNEPDDKFEDRMKADMGDDMYDQRQKKLEFRGKAPMYNKDPQPIEDTTSDKVQFNKEQSSWNERKGLKEMDDSITGRFVDILGKKRYIDFNLDEAKLISGDKLDENYMKVDFTGLGNFYDSKGNLNEGVKQVTESYQFYTDGKNVVAVKHVVKKLNENEQKQVKRPVNEEFNKMKHLLGYNPKTYINTKNNKL